MQKSLAIIGAGLAGLASLKAAAEEGLDAVAFDPRPDCGGLWEPSTGLTWPGLRTNLSKYSCSFSDHLHATGTDLFLTARQLEDYLRSYADTFSLRERIRPGCRVTSAVRDQEGWCLSLSTPSGTVSQRFDALIVASGSFSTRVYPPDVQGVEEARFFHSADYRGPEPFAGQRVAVVGGAFSGADMAGEISRFARQTTIVIRRPAWYVPRSVKAGAAGRVLPNDLVLYSREKAAAAKNQEPKRAAAERNAYFLRLLGDQGAIHPLLRVPPDAEEAGIVFCDDFLPAVKDGCLRVVSAHEIDLRRDILGDSEGGTSFDKIVFATGFKPDLSFLGEAVQKDIGYDANDTLQPVLLAKCVFPRETPELAFVGMYRGAFFATMELQARWACAVLAQRLPPLTAQEKKEAIAAELAIKHHQPRPQLPHPNYVALSDGIAERLGVLPHVDGSGELKEALWSGPLLPGHYRLVGPHSNPSKALVAIEEVTTLIRDGAS